MYYGIAVFPSKEIQEFANDYRRRYDPHFQSIEPHLTVREKEEWNEQQLEEAIAEIERNIESVKPIELHFNRFSAFYPVSNVIYMALSNPQPLLKLHEAICSGPLVETGKPYVYTPHLTIAQELNDDELHDVLASLKNTKLNFKCTIDTIALLRKEADGQWARIKEFKL
ncbi:2'-5' RNA ligase family protein [Paenibacillus cremeus]|uniref:Phosphoesterase n=1 Tax=Paenibacillus cremeus TaxID=2163881 RepID=A0A559KBP8_9BACL|nr:2'-5' RNA ligase family protein [Paenibacillus cremeus]TVY09541.1 hypothetical protein FPZ49_12425 [Paenibacillus cremeus]